MKKANIAYLILEYEDVEFVKNTTKRITTKTEKQANAPTTKETKVITKTSENE